MSLFLLWCSCLRLSFTVTGSGSICLDDTSSTSFPVPRGLLYSAFSTPLFTVLRAVVAISCVSCNFYTARSCLPCRDKTPPSFTPSRVLQGFFFPSFLALHNVSGVRDGTPLHSFCANLRAPIRNRDAILIKSVGTKRNGWQGQTVEIQSVIGGIGKKLRGREIRQARNHGVGSSGYR